MARRCGTGAALFFTALVLAGCSLVESVIVFEPAREAAKPVQKAVRAASIAPEAVRCGQSAGGQGCAGMEAAQKTHTARYDSGPVLRPIKKKPGIKAPEEAEADSRFMKSVKIWLRSGMQLPTWIARD